MDLASVLLFVVMVPILIAVLPWWPHSRGYGPLPALVVAGVMAATAALLILV